MFELRSARGGSPLRTTAGRCIRAADQDGEEKHDAAGTGMTGDEGAVVKETRRSGNNN